MYPRKPSKTLWIPILALALCFADGGTAAAQRIDDRDLLKEAQRSADDDDWLAVTKYLFAYISREPPGMRDDPAVSRALARALDDAQLNLELSMEQEYAGMQGSKGLPPPLVSVDIPTPGASRSGDERRSRPRSLALVCRGGGKMFFNYYPQEDRPALLVHFLKAEWSGSEPSLSPGTCTWLGRPVDDEEPFWLALDLPSSKAGIGLLTSDPAGTARSLDDLRVRLREIEETKLRWLLEHVVSPERFVVFCYDDGQYLRVTRVTPPR